MAFSKDEIFNLYRKRARRYDLSANLYYLIGFREHRYRVKAVERLSLKNGDTVVEIGCGTGLNFPLIQNHIGPTGKIIGVDLTDKMLTQARKRVEAKGWSNVELVQADASKYEFPDKVNGVISTFAITLIPDYERIIKNGAAALQPGGHLVILDLKLPQNWPMWLIHLAIVITKPFGVTLDLSDRHPWEAVNRYLAAPSYTELFGGFAYISCGESQAR